MKPQDWPAIVGALMAAGISQAQIARACGCGQATISDIHRGGTKDPRASTALMLLAMADAVSVRTSAVKIPDDIRALVAAAKDPGSTQPSAPTCATQA